MKSLFISLYMSEDSTPEKTENYLFDKNTRLVLLEFVYSYSSFNPIGYGNDSIISKT